MLQYRRRCSTYKCKVNKTLRGLLDGAVNDMQRTVVVTGSSGGIGSKICEAFKAEKWTVIG